MYRRLHCSNFIILFNFFFFVNGFEQEYLNIIALKEYVCRDIAKVFFRFLYCLFGGTRQCTNMEYQRESFKADKI